MLKNTIFATNYVRMKKSFIFLFVSLLIMAFSSCRPEGNLPAIDVVDDSISCTITPHCSYALVNCRNLSTSIVIDTCYIKYSTNDSLNNGKVHLLSHINDTTSSDTIPSLTPGMTYYYTILVYDLTGPQSTDTFSFQTLFRQYPRVVTDTLYKTNNDTLLSVTGLYTFDDETPITEWGFQWSIDNANFETIRVVNDTACTDSLSMGMQQFDTIIPFHSCTTYVRAYAVNEEGTGFGAVKVYEFEGPKAITNEISNIKETTCTLSGTIQEGVPADRYQVKEKGFCISTNPNPTVNDMKYPSGVTGWGAYESEATGLEAGNDYYARAYAILKSLANGQETTIYSDEDQPFSTIQSFMVTFDYELIPDSRIVLLMGDVIGDAPWTIALKGFAWVEQTDPSQTEPGMPSYNDIQQCGSGFGYFEYLKDDFVPGTRYFVAAVAISGDKQTWKVSDWKIVSVE